MPRNMFKHSKQTEEGKSEESPTTLSYSDHRLRLGEILRCTQDLSKPVRVHAKAERIGLLLLPTKEVTILPFPYS